MGAAGMPPASAGALATAAAAQLVGYPCILPEGLVALWRSWGLLRRPIDDLEQAWRPYPQACEGLRREEQHEPLSFVRLDRDLVERLVDG